MTAGTDRVEKMLPSFIDLGPLALGSPLVKGVTPMIYIGSHLS